MSTLRALAKPEPEGGQIPLASFPGLLRSILLDSWEERKRRTY